jgi:hypothetical protein
MKRETQFLEGQTITRHCGRRSRGNVFAGVGGILQRVTRLMVIGGNP